MKKLGTKTIFTDRLILRKFTRDDCKDMHENWASDKEVSRYLDWYAHKNEAETKHLLEKWVSEYNDTCYNWCIEFEGHAIGNVAVVNFDKETLTAKTAYCIGRDFWGKGIVTEAYKAVLSFLFNEVGINSVCTSHDVRNIGSGKVMEKCGLYEIRTENTTLKGENITISIKQIKREEF